MNKVLLVTRRLITKKSVIEGKFVRSIYNTAVAEMEDNSQTQQQQQQQQNEAKEQLDVLLQKEVVIEQEQEVLQEIQTDQEISPKEKLKEIVTQRILPIINNGRYENPWNTYKHPSFLSVFKWKLTEKNLSSVPSVDVLNEKLPVMDLKKDSLLNPPENKIRATWIGHATVFVQLNSINIITDPIFSHRCSPSSMMGPSRFRPPPCAISELPSIDIVVISHSHYDHLSYPDVLEIEKHFHPKWVVPLGLKAWFADIGIHNVVELNWWQAHETKVEGNDNQIKVTCVPAQHWGRRSLFDQNCALWGGFVLESGGLKFYFAGDTGYCEGFKEIGEHFGSIDLAAIPIGAYSPRWFMCSQHVDPKQAVQIHIDVRAKKSLGIHWGTFVLTDEHYLEPPQLLKEEAKNANLEENDFFVTRHGEVFVL